VSTQAVGIGMIGGGTVGAGVAQLLHEQRELYEQRLGQPIELVRVLVRDLHKHRPSSLPADLLTDDADAFFGEPDIPIIVEVAGGCGVISDHVQRALGLGKHVVTANKSLLAAQGAPLFELAHQQGVSIAFEASCGGGVPIITALQFGLMANRVQGLYGILNGTCNYILTQMSVAAKSYDVALDEAKAKGFAEADPTLDVNGQDTAQKLAVLASLAFGVRVEADRISCQGIDNLEVIDIRLSGELGYVVKLLAIGEQDTGGAVSLCVKPCLVPRGLPLASVQGSYNALSVYGHAVGHTMYYGQGAGQLPTASAVVSDLLNVASGWYPRAFLGMNLWCDKYNKAVLVDADELQSRYYLRINAKDEPAVMAKVTTILGNHGISLSAVLQHEPAQGRFVPVVIVTHQARHGAVQQALEEIEQLEVIDGKPVCLAIADLPGE